MSIRGYVTIWLGLLALTAVTVTMASLDLGRLAVAAVLVVAATKSTLVLLYFMGLRWEKRLLLKVLVPIAVIALAIFIGLTFLEVLTR